MAHSNSVNDWYKELTGDYNFKVGDIVERRGGYGIQYAVLEVRSDVLKVEWWDKLGNRKEACIGKDSVVKA